MIIQSTAKNLNSLPSMNDGSDYDTFEKESLRCVRLGRGGGGFPSGKFPLLCFGWGLHSR